MSGNCGTALGLWIKNRGEKKNNLLLKRRSLSLLSSAIPGARQGLPSLPRATTGPASAAAVQTTGSTCTHCCRGGGGSQIWCWPPLCTSNGLPSIQLPATLLDGWQMPPANPKECPWDGSQPKLSKGHTAGPPWRGGRRSGWRATSAKTTWGRAGPPLASSLSSPMEGLTLQAAQGSCHRLEQAPRSSAGKESRLRRAPSSTYLDFGLPWIGVCEPKRGERTASGWLPAERKEKFRK